MPISQNKPVKKATTTKRKTKTASKSVKDKIENLLIVESPAKAKTIKKYLGSKYEVMSSKGHIRDLPASRLGVDIENGFKPEYIVSRKDGKTALIKELVNAAKNSQKVLLATDPDREGEAIAWHLAQILNIDPSTPVRVTFNEITKNVIKQSVENPRLINENLFNAQQTRRVLDRIVGYKLSPFLWKKVKKGLSAGRVQSVATRLVVDKEREIQNFKPVEYWLLDALFNDNSKPFSARFYGSKTEKMALDNEAMALDVIKSLEKAEFKVENIKNQEKLKSPRPPFITSSLQQDASARLNMRPQLTMSIAQSLYEGVDVKGHGLVGLITYMRTDSMRISEDAAAVASDYIKEHYGAEYYPDKPHNFKTKNNSQDAHEAIRPTNAALAPDSIKESLSNEQYKLYKLIWERFMASQMASAVYDTVSVDISAGDYIFRTTDSIIRFKGFTIIYNDEDNEELGGKLPKLEKEQVLSFKEFVSEQKFTQPPLRYTEASLIKALEEYGIGRPSTYAPTISTIQERQYVEKDGKTLVPTQLGYITTDIMTENFKDIVDVSFTADMEQRLDKVEEGSLSFVDVMSGFYNGFEKKLAEADEKTDAVKIKIEDEVSDVDCELCGSKMVYKISRYGRFLACPNYPTCKNTKSIVIEADGNCPKCGSKTTVRKSKKGKTYFMCADYKNCDFMTWDIPTKELCPKCGSSLFRHSNKLICLKETCLFEKEYKKNEQQ